MLRASKVGLVVCHALKEGPAEITSAGVLPPDYQASDILDFLGKLRTIYETRSKTRTCLNYLQYACHHSGRILVSPQRTQSVNYLQF